MHALGNRQHSSTVLNSRSTARAPPYNHIRPVVGRRGVLVRAEAAAGGDKVVCVGEALFGECARG